MLIELSSDNLSEIVSNNENVVAIYGAPWCGNCRILKPHIKKLAEEDHTRMYVYVDASKHDESTKLSDIRNLPSISTFVNGLFDSKIVSFNINEVKKFLNIEIKSPLTIQEHRL